MKSIEYILKYLGIYYEGPKELKDIDESNWVYLSINGKWYWFFYKDWLNNRAYKNILGTNSLYKELISYKNNSIIILNNEIHNIHT